MKKILVIFSLTASLGICSCSNQNSGINNEAGSTNSTAVDDSSTANPMNSEYGTPNASENPLDSAQSVNQDSVPK